MLKVTAADPETLAATIDDDGEARTVPIEEWCDMRGMPSLVVNHLGQRRNVVAHGMIHLMVAARASGDERFSRFTPDSEVRGALLVEDGAFRDLAMENDALCAAFDAVGRVTQQFAPDSA